MPRSAAAIKYRTIRSKDSCVTCDRLCHFSLMAIRGGGPGGARLLPKASSWKQPEPAPTFDAYAAGRSIVSGSTLSSNARHVCFFAPASWV
eukprot:2926930-Lingulodinium_polyedra.AAC.1